MSEDQYQEYRQAVLEGAKSVHADGLVQFGEGNVSIRVKKEDELFITPSQNDYATMAIDDVVHVKFDGTQLSKGRPTSSEYKLHVAIYKARKKANCVIHTHSTYAGMLSILKDFTEIPVIYEEQVIFLGGPVRKAAYATSGTEELGENALEAMGDTNVCLLQNHSIVACGRDIQKTVKAANLVEKMAQIYWGALQVGGDISVVPEENLGKFQDYFKGLFATGRMKK